MNPFAKPAEPLPPAMEAVEPLELTRDLAAVPPACDQERWAESQADERGAGATGKLGRITREFDTSSEKLKHHGEALDRAAESARNDIAVLLDDLPRAEESARAVAEQLRTVGSQSAAKAVEFGEQVNALAERTSDTDRALADAAERLKTRLAEIETASTSAVA